MPKRNDIKSVMIIGAGPIIIGQACEFDILNQITGNQLPR